MDIQQKVKSLTTEKSFLTVTLILFSLIVFKLYFLLFSFEVALAERASTFSWSLIFLVIVMGYLGYFMSLKIDVARIWDDNVSNFQRFGIPAITGFIYGVITVFRDYQEHINHPHQISEKFHVAFPHSIAFYSFGAVFLEVFLRLFGISLIVWLFSRVVLRKRFEVVVFWIAAVITSWYEISAYIKSYTFSEVAWGILSPLFISNMVEAYEFKKYGFWAPLVFRFVFYIVWHIVWGNLITQS